MAPGARGKKIYGRTKRVKRLHGFAIHCCLGRWPSHYSVSSRQHCFTTGRPLMGRLKEHPLNSLTSCPCSCSCLVCRPVYSVSATSFVFFWPKHFPDTPLLYPPNFDARIVSYPTAEVSANKPRFASIVYHCSGGDSCRLQCCCLPNVFHAYVQEQVLQSTISSAWAR